MRRSANLPGRVGHGDPIVFLPINLTYTLPERGFLGRYIDFAVNEPGSATISGLGPGQTDSITVPGDMAAIVRCVACRSGTGGATQWRALIVAGSTAGTFTDTDLADLGSGSANQIDLVHSQNQVVSIPPMTFWNATAGNQELPTLTKVDNNTVRATFALPLFTAGDQIEWST